VSDVEVIAPFLAATVRTATPLALAALGEVLVERAGLINIGLEGAILSGAFGALVGATAGGVSGGYAGAMAGGLLVGALFALCVVVLRADQIITGTALTLLGVGATGTLYRALFGSTGAALSLATSAPLPIPGLSSIPVVGAALFAQPPITYLVYLLAPALAWWLARTHAGLAVRAIGERPEAAEAAGVHVNRLRVLVVLVGGVLGGLAGGTLVLA
jgi:general nucleoside transport system permease protein